MTEPVAATRYEVRLLENIRFAVNAIAVFTFLILVLVALVVAGTLDVPITLGSSGL